MEEAKDLDALKAELYLAFNECVSIAKEDFEVDSIANRTLAADLIQAAAAATQAIVAIESEQREAKAVQIAKLDK